MIFISCIILHQLAKKIQVDAIRSSFFYESKVNCISLFPSTKKDDSRSFRHNFSLLVVLYLHYLLPFLFNIPDDEEAFEIVLLYLLKFHHSFVMEMPLVIQINFKRLFYYYLFFKQLILISYQIEEYFETNFIKLFEWKRHAQVSVQFLDFNQQFLIF